MEEPRKLGGFGHLFYFTSLQLIIFADRSLLAALMPNVQRFFSIGDTRSGLLGSGFMGGFMVMSPFVAMARGKAIFPTIGISLVIWMLAEVATCFASSYNILLLARVMAGAGEAGFCALGPPLIDDTAPPSKRSLFVAVFYSAVFVGMAAGFVASIPFKDWEEARFAFLGLPAVMAPYCIFIFVFSDRFHISLTSRDSREMVNSIPQCSEGQPARVPGDSHRGLELDSFLLDGSRGRVCGKLLPIYNVLESGVFDFLVLGFSASQFVIGGFAFWASDYLQNDLALSKSGAGLALGLMTVATGIIGSASGGALLDKLTECAKARWDCDDGVRCVVGCGLCTFLSVFVVPASCAAAWLKDGTAFLVCLGGTQMFSFLGAAPFMIATMDSVPSHLRGMAMGMTTLGGHLLGDLFSPTFVGKVADATGSLRCGIFGLSLWSVWCPIMWSAAYCLASRRFDTVTATASRE